MFHVESPAVIHSVTVKIQVTDTYFFREDGDNNNLLIVSSYLYAVTHIKLYRFYLDPKLEFGIEIKRT